MQPGEAARKWKECDARALTYSLDSLLTSMIPVHKEMVNEGEWPGVRLHVSKRGGCQMMRDHSCRACECSTPPNKQLLHQGGSPCAGEAHSKGGNRLPLVLRSSTACPLLCSAFRPQACA